MALRQHTKVTSQVTGPGIKVASNDGMALSKALKISQQLYSASRVDSKYKGVLKCMIHSHQSPQAPPQQTKNDGDILHSDADC